MGETKEIKKYTGTVRIDNKLEHYEFKTDGDPVEHLWERYGMSTYIADLEEVTPKAEIELNNEEEFPREGNSENTGDKEDRGE